MRSGVCVASEQLITRLLSSFVQNPEIADQLSIGFSRFIRGMESLDRSKEKELKDKRLTNRLRLVTTRVKMDLPPM